jgi:di/tricarboxylate transporter
MVVLIAASAGFITPIGYQTHMMVWAPGGYAFIDFVKFGVGISITYWFVGSLLIPVFYPF